MSEPGAHARGTRTSDYDFELPDALIAQLPLPQRDASRLLTVNRESGEIAHRAFTDLPSIIAPGDALVLNTTKVLRARLLGTRDSGARAEILLLHPLPDGTWEAMVSPGGKLHPGRRVHIAPGFDVEIVALTDRRTRIVRLVSDENTDVVIERHGHIPLPPYIARADTTSDAERYQTVYAQEKGSVAAPTAGLHMTDALLAKLASRGIHRVDVVLHVGAGTFKPVEVDDPGEHPMHEERYEISSASAKALNAVRARGAKIWALGTTSARALESAVGADGRFAESKGETRLFVRPPYTFRGVDRLITNFHLPRSTLLMLVAALAGYDLTMRAYREAVDAGYRFYSYGDAMAVV
ncbi:MAG: tRNA preQ1(34) S-adenosylmethionine ribosyltransferase-isomerase QueA [Gemmatimonadota bacterium]